ncbi:MAG: hypothetical protein ACJAY1_001798, partial [Glaciecola sp.]
ASAARDSPNYHALETPFQANLASVYNQSYLVFHFYNCVFINLILTLILQAFKY